MSCTLFCVPRVSKVASLMVSTPCGVAGQSGLVTTPVLALVVRWQKRMVLARWSRS